MQLYKVTYGAPQTTVLVCRQCADHYAGIHACQTAACRSWFPFARSAEVVASGDCPWCSGRVEAYQRHDRAGISA